MPLKKQKVNDAEVVRFGFLGGISEALYVFLLVVILSMISKILPSSDNISSSLLGLLIFVFSAGISGILVFGYPAYLAFQKRFAEALMTAVITLLTLLITGILVFVLISLV